MTKDETWEILQTTGNVEKIKQNAFIFLDMLWSNDNVI